MAKTDFKTIDEYHHTFSGDILDRMQTIREMAHTIAPEYHKTLSAIQFLHSK